MLSRLIEFPKTSATLRTFPNGLELIVKEDHTAPAVSLQAWCRAGSIHEGEWLGAGMSHFLEHMLFKGTSKRSANEIAQTVQAAGGYINAYTSFDRTVYWIDSTAEGFETCLDVLCDVVGDAQIPEEEFAKEADVIRREFAMGDDNPDQVLQKLLFHTALAENPCRHPVIGHLDLFDQLTRDDLYEYYRRQYSPDNLFVVIAGDVDSEKVHDLVGAHLGGLDRRRRRRHEAIPDEPRQMGRREARETFPTELSRIEMAWHTPGVSHPDMPALDVLATVAGNGKSSRLYRTVREQLGLAHSLSAYSYTPAHSGLFIVSVETEPEKRDAAAEAALETLREIGRRPISQAELDKAVRQTLSAQFRTLTTMRGQASDLGSNWILTRNLDFTRDYANAVQRITREEVAAQIDRYLTDDGLTLVSLDPAGATAGSLPATGPARTEDVKKIILPNGLTVLLLADHRVPLVTAFGAFRGGMLAATPETAGVCRFLSRLLTKDTKRRSAEELAARIESAGGSLSSSDGQNTFSVSAGVMRPDLALAIESVAESLLEPAFLGETVDRERQYQIAAIKAEDDRPFTPAMLALRRALFGSAHPLGLRGSGSAETLAGLSGSELESLRSRLVCGHNGVLGIFGDLDLAEAEALVRERFESALPAGEAAFTDRESEEFPDFADDQVVNLTHEKEQAILLVGFRTDGIDNPRTEALDLIDEACSDMASRVFIRIREELGAAYSVGASQMVGLGTGLIVFYAATAPERLDQVQAELLGEIDALRDRGLEPDELERARSSFLGREILNLQSAQQLAGAATVDELLGLGWDHYRKTPERIRALINDDLREAAAHYFTSQRRVIVRLSRG